MTTVSVRSLRNEGGQVLERVVRGESLTVTLDGHPVAELRPLPAARRTAAELIRRRRHLPAVDLERMRDELDALLDFSR